VKTHERVKFRLIHTPCCGTLLCWVNPRLPNHCPECGVQIYGKLHTDPTRILVTDEDAELTMEVGNGDLHIGCPKKGTWRQDPHCVLVDQCDGCGEERA
jgi:hypothetical protein